MRGNGPIGQEVRAEVGGEAKGDNETTMRFTRLLVLSGLLGLAACSSSPTEPQISPIAEPPGGQGIGVVQPCGAHQSASYPLCNGKQ